MRNPLAPISNALHILHLTAELSPSALRVCEIIEKQVGHLVRLVDDLLDVSRISAGRIELRKEAVDLVSVIEGAVETSKPLIEAAGHQLAISISPDAVIIDADPVRITQVISNLLNNAAKYTNQGGQIWISARPENGQAVISVRDSGIGIAREMLPRVFDIFAQVDRSPQRVQGGLGIGLALAKSLVQMHGGDIEAHSEGLGHGTEFIVRLPLAPINSVPRPAPPRTNMTQLPPHRVLVVDDTKSAAIILAKLLEMLGQNVSVAHSGAQALETAQREHPDLIISDIAMPMMDGYELARQLRRQPGLNDVMLVALTGYGQDCDRQRTKAAGFSQHLVKPVGVDSLHDLLESLPDPANI